MSQQSGRDCTVGLIGAGNIAPCTSRPGRRSAPGCWCTRCGRRAASSPGSTGWRSRPSLDGLLGRGGVRRHRHAVADAQGDRAGRDQGRPGRDLREAADADRGRLARGDRGRGGRRRADLPGARGPVLPGVRRGVRRGAGGPDRRGRGGAVLPPGVVTGRRRLVPGRGPVRRRDHGPDGARPRPGPLALRRGHQRVRRTEPADRGRDQPGQRGGACHPHPCHRRDQPSAGDLGCDRDHVPVRLLDRGSSGAC